MALCHFLPGPTSSQLGIAAGITRGGIVGGILAWIGFTLPSALLLIAFAFGAPELESVFDGAWLKGLKIAAVAVVAQALWGMGSSLASDRARASVAVVAAIAVLLLPFTASIVVVILVAGVYGWWRFQHYVADAEREAFSYSIPKWLGIACGLVFFGLLIALPIALRWVESDLVAIFDSFFRSGSLVFGGGHVVLPTLESEVVAQGWIGLDRFIAGYGASQAIPGPLFTFSAYLGTAMDFGPGGVFGGVFALVAIFLPSFLMVVAILPFWQRLSDAHRFRAALVGINAAVVGILAAALFDPVWSSTIESATDFALAAAAFGLLMFWKMPSWAVVVICAVVAIPLAWFQCPQPAG